MRIWENMQRRLDAMFKATGHENAYFPLFIPLSFLEKEAAARRRLRQGMRGGHAPSAGAGSGRRAASRHRRSLKSRWSCGRRARRSSARCSRKWVQSYRDLPILINQWANVVRWELRTRLFLRTTEFLWQEGHTAHATADEATKRRCRCSTCMPTLPSTTMAMPVIKGEKTAGERFPGAVNTYSIEAMMQDRKALQAGTSHFLGQNFREGAGNQVSGCRTGEESRWTTSWGVSTRLIGGLIMTHSDDDGLVLPPRLAPAHVVIMPIFRNDEERATVLDYCQPRSGS